MQQLILIGHVCLAFCIIGLVLLQHGKGAEVGASFGSGASQTVFGSQGATSFLGNLTIILAVLFAITSLGLGYLNTKGNKQPTILEQLESVEAKEIPNIPKAEKILNQDEQTEEIK